MGMEPVANDLRDTAAKCRDLAAAINDRYATLALNELAVDLEKRAAQAEAIRSPQGPRPL